VSSLCIPIHKGVISEIWCLCQTCALFKNKSIFDNHIHKCVIWKSKMFYYSTSSFFFFSSFGTNLCLHDPNWRLTSQVIDVDNPVEPPLIWCFAAHNVAQRGTVQLFNVFTCSPGSNDPLCISLRVESASLISHIITGVGENTHVLVHR